MYYTFNCYTCKYTCISTHVMHMKHNTCITGVAEVASIVHQSKLFIFLNNLNKGVVNNSGTGGGALKCSVVVKGSCPQTIFCGLPQMCKNVLQPSLHRRAIVLLGIFKVEYTEKNLLPHSEPSNMLCPLLRFPQYFMPGFI